MEKLKNYFSKGEIVLWVVSVTAIVISFVMFSNDGIITLIASLIGVTSIIINAKGNPAGQAMMIIFSLLYGLISFGCAYYGEMITYLGMTAPMAVIALISWLRNPYGNGLEVKVNHIKSPEILLIATIATVVTVVFYFILKFFHTANLIISTFSVMTSFIAVYLTFRRSAFFSLAYALNDIVLVILWGLASFSNMSYISVVVCFVMFLVNDIYGFVSWRKMEKRQFFEQVEQKNIEN
ncbi:MAG: nicotinamide riboside transporter PnuC [Ruminococcus sp.]|nr:nicotinamide riboside transporter PnuC [Ruminococcus sp.]MDE6679577.1 nicotinamide riboside transporter PnuC [Ruminococcus sp.]